MKKNHRFLKMQGKKWQTVAAFLACTGSAAAIPYQSAAVEIVQQQDKLTVTGTVTDKMGPVIGATIQEKGTSNGIITDLDGKYQLTVSPRATLVITFVGYKPMEVTVAGRKEINVTLTEDTQTLDEVVVVGYGTQKKVNLTGSVASINVGELTESRPIHNISQALAGLAAGVQVSSSSNQPGNDNASIKVRGQGTLNSSAPLIIIDGVEAGINTVNPQDIESMSVLKDAASAAIYGSRAANGVILITTKRGKAGGFNVEYSGYLSFQSIRRTLTPVSNYAEYMQLVNEGYTNSGLKPPFSESTIQEWKDDAGKNPLLYPNTDWIKETFRPSTATNHVLSVSGGSEKLRFYASYGYRNDPGVIENAGFKKHNARLNVDANIKPWLRIGMQLSGQVSDMGPAGKYKSSGTVIDDLFTYASATTPGMVFRAPDGRYGAVNSTEDAAQAAQNNPLARLNSIAGNIRKNQIRSLFTATVTPWKGWSVTGTYSYELTDQQVENKPVFIDKWNFRTETITSSNRGKSSVYNANSKVERYFNDVTLRYESRWMDKRMGFNALLGASQELYRSKQFNARKFDLIDTGLDVIDAAVGEASAGGSRTEWAMHSYFGRIHADWENKYLVEMNLRADASSRFLKERRWGYFPSFSAAWRMDQETFMEPLTAKGLSNLKLRLSYGSLGNNSVGNYDALALFSNKDKDGRLAGYVLNNNLVMGLVQAAIANSRLTWETTRVTDIGLDFGLANNRLTGTIDYFHKRTTDILINLPAPDVHGIASIPKENSATVTNRGVEFTLGWQDRIKEFTYGINANFTYVRNKVNKFKGKELSGQAISGANLIWEGHSINSQYLLTVDRLLQTDEDMKMVQQMIDNAPTDENGKKKNPFAAFGTPKKGDLLYKDVNGDGIIDNNDKRIVSDGPNPKYLFGLNLTAGWRGIDFSMLLQGSAGIKVFWMNTPYNTPSVRTGYQLNKKVTDGRWYEGRTDATYPRLLEYNNRINMQNSDFYLEDKAFVKIRNIQLGYTLPKAWTQRAHINRLRLYGSLENFFTFTRYNGFDPEVSGMNYPTMKQAVIGLNITF